MAKKRVGFFGGTFDPIHNGHLNLAFEILEIKKLDEILFCPAHLSPFKGEAPPEVNPQQRLLMLEIATCRIPQFKVTPIEIDRPPPSFTIDTIKALKEDGHDYFLILSEEALDGIEGWKEVEKLFELAPPIIGTRVTLPPAGEIPPSLKALLDAGLCATSVMEISSTSLKERFKNNLYCSHLVPPKVVDFILKNHLYSVDD